MKIIKIDAKTYESIVSEKAHGLPAHFERIREGTKVTPQSPLFKVNRKAAVEEWKQVLSRNLDKYPRLIEYEDTRWSKFGPQGASPALEERMEQLELYFTRYSPAPILQKGKEYQETIKIVREKLFKTHSLRKLTPEQVLKRDVEEDKVNTNSGLPDFSKRNAHDVQQKAVQDAKSGKWVEYPAILGSRSVRQKPRFIFMFPMSVNLVEKQYVIPIMEAIRSHKPLSFSAWEGFDDVELAFHKQNAFSAKYKASMDYTGMDQTMGPDQMTIVYDILAPVFQPQERDGLYNSLMHSINIPVMISEDKVTEGTHGLASGSGWTNLTESILSQFVHELINARVKLIGDQLLGDDGALTYNDEIDFAQVISECSAECGLEANKDKQNISDKTLTYLQRFFDEDIKLNGVVVGSYPTVLALNAGMNPERFHDPRKWNERMEILRWLMILENCKHHPLFTDLVDHFIKGDKFKLGLSIPGYFKRLAIQDYEVAKTIRDFVPSYNQASIDRGIEDFEVYKYLKSKVKSVR